MEETPRCILPNLSDEQASILDKIEDGYNTTTQAYPGSGKTKLFEQIVLAFPHRNIIAISYNAKLVKATNRLIAASLVEHDRADTANYCIKTYHGLLSSLVKKSIHNELLFAEALQYMNFKELGKTWPFRNFDMLVIDEAQDLRKHYLLFIVKLILYVCPDRSKLQVHGLGDIRQVLYDFYPINKADARFLTHMEDLLGPVLGNRPWHHAQLSVSFRATPQIANVINALVPSRKMISGKPDKTVITNWVTLYIADVYADAPQIVYDIVKRKGIKNRGKILILCASLNEKSVAVRIVDLLVANNIPVHVDRSGSLASGVSTSTDTEQNKVRLNTLCGGKGLESDIVIMVNTNELLAEEFIDNPRYVGISRPREELYIIQNAHYTSQNQIDALIANPLIKQADLRIIQKRPIKMELSKRRSQEKQDMQYYSKNALSCSTLFAFIDVEHLEVLLQYVGFHTVIDGLGEQPEQKQEEAQEAKEEEEEKIIVVDDDAEHSTPCANYIGEMTKSFDDGLTFINLVNISSIALKFALEFAFTRKIPQTIKQILVKIGTEMDPKYAMMRNLIHDSIQVLDSSESQKMIEISGMETFIVNNISHFASLAVVSDAFQGYRELLFAVTSFSFLCDAHVTTRFQILYESMQQILDEHEISGDMLVWQKEHIGRFIHKNDPVQIKVQPAATSQDHNIVVLFTTNASTGHEDRLSALVHALVVAELDPLLEHTAVYIMNVFDASTQRVYLRTPEPQKAGTEVDIEPCAKRIKLEISKDKPTAIKLETTEEKDKRRIPCAFLDAAITFKMWKHDQEQDDAAIVKNEIDYEQDTQQFIANLQIEIQAMITDADAIVHAQNKKEDDDLNNDY